MTKCALLAAVGILAGCGGSPRRPLTAEVRYGAGYSSRPAKILALSASCGSVEFHCPRDYVATVDNIVRSSMGFAGYQLVVPESLRADTRQRSETHTSETTTTRSHSTVTKKRTLAFDKQNIADRQSTTTTESSVIHLDGSGFSDLTVPQKRAVLAEAGADAVLVTRVVVGAAVGNWDPDQRVEVMVKLSVGDGSQMAWAARCSASSNDFSSVNAALENAARCAVHGATTPR